jgi:uncharacterized membrane protein
MTTSIYFFLGAIFNALAAFLIKLSFSNINSFHEIFSSETNKEILLMSLGVISFLSAFIFYGMVLSKTSLSIGQPIFTSLSMIFVILLSVIFLNEPFTFKYAIGIMSIIIGIVIISQS